MKGRLECTHCGQTFLVQEGQYIKIDHFNECPGAPLEDEIEDAFE